MLEVHGMCTIDDVARVADQNEDVRYKLFGKNAEQLIDHAWGWEHATMLPPKAYCLVSNSLGGGQVRCVHTWKEKHGGLREMTVQLDLGLVY